MFNELITANNILHIGLIMAASVVLACLFLFFIHRILKRWSKKTNTVLDDLILRTVKWPVFTLIILAGCFFSVAYLPFQKEVDDEISRALHLAFIVLGGISIVFIIDAVFRWFKLEVTAKTNTPIDDWITIFVRIISPVIFGLLTLIASLELYNIDAQWLKHWLITYGIEILVVLVIAIIALFILGIIGSKAIVMYIANRPPEQPIDEVRKRANTLSGVIITTGQVLIIVVALFIILSEFVDVTPALASAGVLGIAIGLGAQSLVKDLIGGFFIVMENQYRIGDVVNVSGIGGLVEDLNLRRTILRDVDGTVHSIPNGQITVASNLTKDFSRVNLNISVSYDTDLDHAIEVANQVCREMAGEPDWAVLINKTPSILRVDKLGDSGIDLKITGETKPIQQWAVMGELRKRLKKTFDQEGIEIPWPHTKVYFGNSLLHDEQNRKK